MKYEKKTTRIPVLFIDADTEKTILEVPDRNATNLNEFFVDVTASLLITRKIQDGPAPKRVLVIASAEFFLVDEK
jgi:hypothetical protein